MFAGDHNRKSTLVEHGFRLPSALDNRPLQVRRMGETDQAGDLRLGHARARTNWRRPAAKCVEQVIRPTGLLDPEIEVAPARTQVPHLLEQIRERAAVGERVLVTTLTKRLAEDLSAYLRRSRTSAANGCTASSTPSSASSCCATCARGSSTCWWA